MHAYFLAKTRSVCSGGGGYLCLLPLHDAINHSDAPNCSLTTTAQG